MKMRSELDGDGDKVGRRREEEDKKQKQTISFLFEKTRFEEMFNNLRGDRPCMRWTESQTVDFNGCSGGDD
ncbi:hypothetical protein PoB_002623900 [Plakobranchus ocellatus]|uniref:Uncharacterized protein n=1 Tax=Plakobranchus ocellatus TaxID=259542 RepID=A0AAV3ZWN8_9GAST|nr:hypothetical protein PoB_002623900 [Plakobranchus ocellatus]